MTESIIILGSGGTCIDILEIAEAIQQLRPEQAPIGFLDDDISRHGRIFGGFPVLGTLKDAGRFSDAKFVNGIGSPRNFWRRKEILQTTGLSDERFITLVHPSAQVSRSARIGTGVVIFPGAVIHNNVTIKDHVLILSNAVIGHDCSVGEHSIIASGVQLAGDVRLEDTTYIGAGATILGGVRVGTESIVGAGSVVCHPVVERQVVAGSPARFLRNTR